MKILKQYWGVVLAVIIIGAGTLISLQKSSAITLISPVAGERIGQPLLLLGTVQGDSEFVYYRLSDSQGPLVEGQKELGPVAPADVTPFSIAVQFIKTKAEKGILEVFLKDAEGQEVDVLKLSVKFPPFTQEQESAKVFFSNELLNPGSLDCSQVFPVYRLVNKEAAPAQAVLAELLKGPTVEEKQAGYFTSIPEGVRVNSYEVEKGASAVAKADFSDELDRGVGGSCRVIAIRSQIEQTLRQFELVDEVEIAINGRTEDILQP